MAQSQRRSKIDDYQVDSGRTLNTNTNTTMTPLYVDLGPTTSCVAVRRQKNVTEGDVEAPAALLSRKDSPWFNARH